MHLAAQQRAQRREELEALMSAEGLALGDWEWRLAGLRTYLVHGGGSKTPEEYVAQARAMSQPAAAALAQALPQPYAV